MVILVYRLLKGTKLLLYHVALLASPARGTICVIDWTIVVVA